MTNMTEKNQHSKWGLRLLKSAKDYLKKLTGLEMAVLALSTILVLVMFTGGISTMIQEIAGSFPIPKPMRYPVGAGLMIILAWCTKLLSKEFAEMCHDHKRYQRSYRIFLTITTIGALFFCLMVQSESVSIESHKEFQQKMEALTIDSANLKQIDQAIASTKSQISGGESTIVKYEYLKKSRKGKWLSPAENTILINAQHANASATNLLVTLSDKRIKETKRMQEQIDLAKLELDALQEEARSKGRGKAGLVEGLMFFLMFFAVSYKRRFKVQKVDEQELIQEFPKNLTIDQREEMLKQMKLIDFSEESHELLVDVSGEKYYMHLPNMVKQAASYKTRFDQDKRSRSSKETQLRNIAYLERIMAMTPMLPEDLDRVFGYQTLNIGYWNSTTESASTAVSEAIQNRSGSALQQSTAVDSNFF